MKILIVEDEYLVALATAQVLEAAGHSVIGPVATFEDAMDCCEEHAPHLALVDIRLLGLKTGIDVARALTMRWGRIAIFATAQAESARQASDLALGLIGKPYDFRTLLHAVEACGALRDGRFPERKPYGLEIFLDPISFRRQQDTTGS